jgi:hypothetical protein
VLQTIGLGIVLALPPMLVLPRRAARYLLVAFALGFFALFSVSYPSIVAWLPDHHVLGRIFFFEFAPWPWIAIVWIGLLPHAHDRGRPRMPGIVNDHWIARGMTSFLCVGAVFCLLGLAYYAIEVKRPPAE